MSLTRESLIILIFMYCMLLTAGAQSHDEGLNVTSYHVTIEPEIEKSFIKGTVVINFEVDQQVPRIVLSSGDLGIDNLTGNNVTGFKLTDGKVIIELAKRQSRNNELTISYHGHPSRGLLFNKELNQAYTVFSTSQWMVCSDSPEDKAELTLHILAPSNLICVATGTLIQKTNRGDNTLFSWHQEYESPTYTYGFALGQFNTTEDAVGGTSLKYFSNGYAPEELKTIFKETKNILSFFEDRSGIKYYQPAYSQILIGEHYQEMSGFSVLKPSYGKLVLKDSTETNLISHEMAHQWWGNQITCKTWSHFWLNEGLATYMSAAFNEHRFGKAKYNADINSYLKVYEDLKNRGKDRSLVFKQWSNPTSDDRNLVYFKGAYVFHLLRQELGDQAFWNGIKSYSKMYFGKSVETDDFQRAMEISAGRNLDAFFHEHVYAIEQ